MATEVYRFVSRSGLAGKGERRGRGVAAPREDKEGRLGLQGSLLIESESVGRPSITEQRPAELLMRCGTS
jgi:hypothetical protein